MKELGGEVESALTINVTHVVATGFGSPKYNVSRSLIKNKDIEFQYAVENRIPVMTPEWIRSSHEMWISAVRIDLDQAEEEHRLLPFAGLKISISGIEDCASFLAIHETR